MKKILFLMAIVVSGLMSCTDSISLGQLADTESRLIVYAFPTEGDTVDITVSLTYPVSGRWERLQVESVECLTNGTADRIINRGDTSSAGFPIARYSAIGRHRCGDSIQVLVSAVGLPTAKGCTVIPERPTVESTRLDTASYLGTSYPMVRMMMRGNASTPFYAVRMEGFYTDEYLGELWYNAPRSTFMPLKADAEPLFAGSSSTDIDLGSEDSDYYKFIYTFSNSAFTGGRATLHLYVDTGYSNIYKDFRPHLYALSNEYNSMLRSMNSLENNDFGKYGLAFSYSTYTNVQGGYGCIGAYAESGGSE